jgi:hypothetical protein
MFVIFQICLIGGRERKLNLSTSGSTCMRKKARIFFTLAETDKAALTLAFEIAVFLLLYF